ncbi:MAG: adenosylcobinamide-GDP ribazoletransferase [Propionicimonas sp.]|nr:adenosylcobinamide-GDP ribazoletransferase [Propionicimonas sp.]
MTEVRLLLTAVMFYTRIPVPGWVGYSEDALNRSTRYFPAIGWIVGTAVAVVIWLAGLVLPTAVAVVLGLAAGVLLTGAFHEDGFADVCDGFGGGHSAERTLAIMKDSRVGAFAAIGLVLLFGLKLTLLTDLVGRGLWQALVGLVFAHVLSRWCVVTVIRSGTYARLDATSKVRPIGKAISVGGLGVATLWLLPFVGLLWPTPWWGLAVIPAFATRLLMYRWFRRRLGGYTGDCLGALQQVIEVVTLATILALARTVGG